MPNIYESEILNGLEDVIKTSFAEGTSLEAAPILNKSNNATASEIFVPPVFEEVPMDMALVYAVLVSMDWNKNDDVFTPSESWSARHTPVFKPANQDHQKSETDAANKIIGVISQSFAVNKDYQILSEDEDSEKNLEHIVCGINLWERYWPTASADIKENIDEGTQFVSMECLFRDFGYALKAVDGSGPVQLLPRNKDNAKLSRFLRCYKGKGVITVQGKEYRIGRWLRDIVFTGVGFVKEPANPSSIVFNNYVSHASAEVAEAKFNIISEINLKEIEENPDSSVLEDSQPVKELIMAEVKEAPKTEVTVVEPAPSAEAAKVSGLEKQVTDLQCTLDAVRADHQAYKTECEAKMDKMQKDYQSMSETMRAKENAVAMLEATISTLRKTACAKDRYSALAALNMTSILEESDAAKAAEKAAEYSEKEWATILALASKFAKAEVAEVKTDAVASEVKEVKEDAATPEVKAAEAAAAAVTQVDTPSRLELLSGAMERKLIKNSKKV